MSILSAQRCPAGCQKKLWEWMADATDRLRTGCLRPMGRKGPGSEQPGRPRAGLPELEFFFSFLLLVLSHCLFVREVFILLVVLQFSSHFYLFYLLKLFAFRKVIFDYESTIKKYKSGAFLVVQ